MSSGGGGSGVRAVLAALVANLTIAVAKLVGWAITRSGSMLAESIHSLADSGNQVLLLVGRRSSLRPPDARHPFGYGRDRMFSALLVGVVLFTLGGGFAFREGLHKWAHPEPIESVAVALAILGVAIVAEAFSLRTAVGEVRHAGGGSLWRFVRDSHHPELTVIVVEDVAALIGLVLAGVGVGVGALTGEPRVDAAATMAIGVLLAAVGALVGWEMRSLLRGEGADPDTLADLVGAARGVAGVERVVHLRTEYRGPDDLLVAAKLAVDGSATAADAAATIDRAEAAMRAAVPSARWMLLEIDTLDEGRLDASDPAVRSASAGSSDS